MSLFFTNITTYEGILLYQNFYANISIDKPASILDCLNLCVNIQPTTCEFFYFENGFCYLGQSGVSNVILPTFNVTTTIYAKLSKFKIRLYWPILGGCWKDPLLFLRPTFPWYCNSIVRPLVQIEFSPIVDAGANKGHNILLETTYVGLTLSYDWTLF